MIYLVSAYTFAALVLGGYLAHEESVVWGLTERIVAGLAPKLRQAL